MNKVHEYLGVDLGMRKSGIARGNSVARLAEPLLSVKTNNLIDELKRLADKNDVSAIVVGLPRSLEGRDTQQTAWVREWVKDAKKKLNSRFFWQDEALTTKQANATSSPDDDTAAAAIILQDFLDAPAEERVAC